MSTSSDFLHTPLRTPNRPQSSSWSPHQLLPPPTDFYVLHSRPFHSHSSSKWILAGEDFLLFLHSTHNLTLYLAQSSCRFDSSQQSSTTHPPKSQTWNMMKWLFVFITSKTLNSWLQTAPHPLLTLFEFGILHSYPSCSCSHRSRSLVCR